VAVAQKPSTLARAALHPRADMIIKPKIRGFICTTAHPTGCAVHVQQQIDYVKSKGPLVDIPKRVLVIGSSTGYGLASRIVPAFAGGAATVGVFFEKAGEEGRTATAGWYNSVAFERRLERRAFTPKASMGMRSPMRSSSR
jgi:enoyl-[acyl-carrier protein] reductase/trans-2-enoyl-CoA reductase (NAD+)